MKSQIFKSNSFKELFIKSYHSEAILFYKNFLFVIKSWTNIIDQLLKFDSLKIITCFCIITTELNYIIKINVCLKKSGIFKMANFVLMFGKITFINMPKFHIYGIYLHVTYYLLNNYAILIIEHLFKKILYCNLMLCAC